MRLILTLLFSLCVAHACISIAYGAPKKTYAMSQKVFKEIEKVNVFLDQGNYVEAKKLLKKLLDRRISKYEKAQTWFMIGSVEFQQNNTAEAYDAFNKVLNAKGKIPELLYSRTLKTISQLSLLLEKLPEAKHYALTLIKVSEDKPVAEHYALLAQVNYRLDEYVETIQNLKVSLDITKQGNKKPKENVLLLLNATYFEMKSYEEVIETLTQILKYYPKPMYMLYLASIYGQLDQPDKQTVLMESLYENGDLTKSIQLINLANLYLSEKVPYKAAKLLEKSMAEGTVKQSVMHLEMLSQAWMLAADNRKSIDALSLAAEQSDNGDLYLKKAYLHYNVAEWHQTEQSVYFALDKGLSKTNKAGEAWLLLGMVRFHMNQFDKAIVACEKALNFEKSKPLAVSWISYIRSEQTKYEYMARVIDE